MVSSFVIMSKSHGPISFEWDIGPYWQIRIKNFCKRTCKEEPRKCIKCMMCIKMDKKLLFSFMLKIEIIL